MRRRYGKCGILEALVLTLLLGLLLAATPALAGDYPAATMRATSLGLLNEGTEVAPGPEWPEGTTVTENWTPYGVVTATTGPEGWRFMGYAVMCLTVVEPPTGNNYHWGPIVFATADPSVGWNPAYDFATNLPPASTWLWEGTWDGVTLNKHNHLVYLDLTGCNANAGLHASVTWKMNLWTNVQMVALITDEE
jgi:hypothetical protein